MSYFGAGHVVVQTEVVQAPSRRFARGIGLWREGGLVDGATNAILDADTRAHSTLDLGESGHECE